MNNESVEFEDTPKGQAAFAWVFETNGHKWSNDNGEAGDHYGSFLAGYDAGMREACGITEYHANAQSTCDQAAAVVAHENRDGYGLFGTKILREVRRILRDKYPRVTNSGINLTVTLAANTCRVEARNLITGLMLCGALPGDSEDLPKDTTWGYRVPGGTFSFDEKAGFCFKPAPLMAHISVSSVLKNN